MNFIKKMEIELGHRPFWFMRQSGRYMKEYLDLKNRFGLNQMFLNPQIVQEMTELPIKYFNPDFLVIFSDILLSLSYLGYGVNYDEGLKITETSIDPGNIEKVIETSIKNIKKKNPGKKLIGITGGPFTLMSYVYDGHGRGYSKTKRVIFQKPEISLKFIEAAAKFAKVQIAAGCDIVQVFESWVGNMGSYDYKLILDQYEKILLDELKGYGKPIIFFAENMTHILEYVIELSPDILSIDWRIDLKKLSSEYPYLVVQGNLDPDYLYLDERILKDKVSGVLKNGGLFAGHIFNLGHGVPPNIDPTKLSFISKVIKEYE